MAVEPTYSAATERMYLRLPQFYRVSDLNSGFPFKRWLSGIVDQQGAVEELLDRIGYDPMGQNDYFGVTSDLTDPLTADPAWFPWLAMITGKRYDANWSDAQIRQYLNDPSVFAIGSKASIAAAAITVLSGARFITVSDHSTSSNDGGATQWDVLLVTRADETVQNQLPGLIRNGADYGRWTVISGPATVVLNDMSATDPDPWPFHANRVFQVNFTAAGTAVLRLRTWTLPVTAGVVYTASMRWMRDTAVTPSIGIEWLNAAGNIISTQSTTENFNKNPDLYPTKYTLAAKGAAPALTVTARITLSFVVPSARPVYFGELSFQTGPGTEWTLAEPADPISAVINAGVKPAGVKLWHRTVSTNWNYLQTSANYSTWDKRGSKTWAQIQEAE